MTPPMGWCSGTHIIDRVIDRADELMDEMLGAATTDAEQAERDDRLRPLVRNLCVALHDQDWDCEADSVYFLRFPQEMLGCNDDEFDEWIRESYADSPDHFETALRRWHARRAAA
jgi:hypothetical protein